MNQSQNQELTTRQLRWIDALLSGKYEQTKGYLHTEDGYCCLGVVCELYKEDHPEATWSQDGSDEPFEFRASDEYEPAQTNLIPLLRDWIGLRSADGRSLSYGTSLAGLNDKGTSFKAIAALLEAMPEQWFVPTTTNDDSSS